MNADSDVLLFIFKHVQMTLPVFTDVSVRIMYHILCKVRKFHGVRSPRLDQRNKVIGRILCVYLIILVQQSYRPLTRVHHL